MGVEFVKGFFCTYSDDHMGFFSDLLIRVSCWLISVYWRILVPVINPTWQWCMSFLMCCWILFAQILLRIFVSMFIWDIGLWFSFFVLSLSAFGIRVMVASYNEFGSVPSSAIFCKSFRRIGISSSLNVWQNSPVKPSGPGLLFSGRFLITASISVLVIGLLIISIFSWLSLGRLNFSKTPFLPGYPFYCHVVVHNSLL